MSIPDTGWKSSRGRGWRNWKRASRFEKAKVEAMKARLFEIARLRRLVDSIELEIIRVLEASNALKESPAGE